MRYQLVIMYETSYNALMFWVWNKGIAKAMELDKKKENKWKDCELDNGVLAEMPTWSEPRAIILLNITPNNNKLIDIETHSYFSQIG